MLKLTKSHGLTALLMVALILGTLFAGEFRDRTAKLPSTWHMDLATIEARYLSYHDTADLVSLLKAIAYQSLLEGEEINDEKFREYGEYLMNLAREGQVDLEKIDDPEEMRLLLGALRAAGVR